ncbi:hypothetical protein [Glaesserella sp. 15-184]|uniref:hypothetical protein n=1 Tax=Glaesserella sp. 15-184 TaxID=2030797 RepID=UPI00105761F4|nr:hypothetical protein [Glaesserella sp. 15-184]
MYELTGSLLILFTQILGKKKDLYKKRSFFENKKIAKPRLTERFSLKKNVLDNVWYVCISSSFLALGV